MWSVEESVGLKKNEVLGVFTFLTCMEAGRRSGRAGGCGSRRRQEGVAGILDSKDSY